MRCGPSVVHALAQTDAQQQALRSQKLCFYINHPVFIYVQPVVYLIDLFLNKFLLYSLLVYPAHDRAKLINNRRFRAAHLVSIDHPITIRKLEYDWVAFILECNKIAQPYWDK